MFVFYRLFKKSVTGIKFNWMNGLLYIDINAYLGIFDLIKKKTKTGHIFN